jgi:hypothetical protein
MRPDGNHRSRRLGLVPLLGLFAALLPAPVLAEAPKPIDFAHDIVPLIKARCAECHTNGKHKGGLSLDTRQAILRAKVVVPGNSGASELVKRITSRDADERMPPKGERLTEREAALIRGWIDQGLPWQEGFTFAANSYVPPLKPRRPSLPPVREGRHHPIDRILGAYYSSRRQPPPAPVDDFTFARRLYLDVIGQLPAAAELDAFVKDADPAKRDRLIRRLLEDRRAYTEHWLTFWNDLLRNDYQGTGYIDGGRKQITGWLYQSLQQNKPYDQFVRELISPSPESEGFVKGIRWRGKVNASQIPELQFSQNVSQVFFGINMKCASCHDSFIDTWKLDDAYSLAAVIADQPLEIHRCDKALGRKAAPRFLWPELGRIDAAQPRTRRLEQLARLVTHPDNGRFQRTIANRIWQRLFGRGIVHPVDVMANKPWNEDLLDYLGAYLADQGYDLQRLLSLITSSQAYQSRAVVMGEEMPAENYVFRGPEMKRMTAEQFLDAVWQITGTAPAKPAAPVKPPPFASTTPAERRYVRAALVKADALMRSLGRPNREQVVTTRPDQLTTLQALDLSNGHILAETLARGAENFLRENPKATAEQLIERLYVQALCRRPNAAELAAGRAILGTPLTAESLADLLWALFMLPEFQMIH